MTQNWRLNPTNCSLMVPAMRVRQADVIIEHTATGALVCDPGAGVVHRLQPPHSDYLRTATRTGHLPHDRVTLDLIELGILQSAEHHEGLTRRAVLTTVAAVGVTTLTLPNAAAASSTAPASGGGGGGGGMPAPTTTTTTIPLPAAPTSTPTIGRSTATRGVRVVWTSTPEAFTYDWVIYNTDSTAVVQATGTAASASTGTILYTMPAGIVKFRVVVTSNTSPPVSVTSNQSF